MRNGPPIDYEHEYRFAEQERDTEPSDCLVLRFGVRMERGLVISQVLQEVYNFGK